MSKINTNDLTVNLMIIFSEDMKDLFNGLFGIIEPVLVQSIGVLKQKASGL